MNPGISPIAFHIGSWPVYWYGIIFAFVVLLGTLLAANQAKHLGEDPDLVWEGVLIVVIFGLIGGRIYHVIHEWNTLYKNDLPAIFFTWNGGLGIYGGMMGGAIGMAIFARSHKLNLWRWMDIVAPSLILGQAIARWANFINRELYGSPTNLPWALYIEPQYRLPGYEGYAYFQPLFLYESIWDFLVFGFLIWLTRRSKVHLLDGDTILAYLILYSFGRFFLEAIKIGDVWTIFGVRTAQIIAAILVVSCSGILAYRHRRQPAAVVETPKP
jgi:phosphatidylglycerol:prolipoprotein diacylglycerol transferase